MWPWCAATSKVLPPRVKNNGSALPSVTVNSEGVTMPMPSPQRSIQSRLRSKSSSVSSGKPTIIVAVVMIVNIIMHLMNIIIFVVS